MQGQFEITVNGLRHRVVRQPLARRFLDWLRDDLGLTGAKTGACAPGRCSGACAVCTVDWDGYGFATYRAIPACAITLPMAAGRHFITVEALGNGRGGGAVHPVRRALAESGAGGCGYCAPGIAMALFEIYYRRDLRSVGDIHDALAGQTCRCSSVRGARDAALRLAGEARASRLASRMPGTLERARQDPIELPRIRGDAHDEGLATLDPDPGTLAYIDPDGARFHRPGALREFLRLRKEHPAARLVAGGMGSAGHHDGLPDPTHPVVLSTESVVEMKACLGSDDAWEIGAAVTLSSVGEAIGDEYTLIADMLGRFGSREFRNRATLGGTLCALESVGEVGPAWIALDATAVIAALDRERTLPLEEFLADAPEERLRGEEILARIRLPRRPAPNSFRAHYKISSRIRNAPAIVNLAIDVDLDDTHHVASARVVAGGARRRPYRAAPCEQALVGQSWNGAAVKLAARALREAMPETSDALATGDYRRAATAALLQRFFYEHPGIGDRREIDPQSSRFLRQPLFPPTGGDEDALPSQGTATEPGDGSPDNQPRMHANAS